jgi:hypothetical protein
MRVLVCEEWKPRWAPDWISAWYEPRVRGSDGLPEPQKFGCRCSRCGAEWNGECMSGKVRNHIQKFAKVHMTLHPGDE